MDILRNDLQYALRRLARDPGFAAVAILTLGLGIGANTAIFSVVNSVLLRPLAYQAPERLMIVREVVPKISYIYASFPANGSHFENWRRGATSFESMAAIRPLDFNLTGVGEPERVGGARISAILFAVLGVQPRLGRAFVAEEEQPGRDREVILADSLWRRRFRADPAIVGKAITLEGAPYVVVGILPPSFIFPRNEQLGQLVALAPRTEIFQAVAFTEDERSLLGAFDFAVIGRLKRGVTREQALAELNTIQSAISTTLPDKTELRASIEPLQEQIVGQSRRGLIALLTAVGAVLLIVCVNLANLMLARTAGRGRESAIRTALGASRMRLLRPLVTESLLLALAGGALGIALAAGGLDVLVRGAPVDLPRLEEVRLDGRVLWFALCLATVTGALFGALPAWRLSRAEPQDALKTGGRSGTEGMRGSRLRDTLVAFEVGVSAVLLITAGLLVSSFVRLIGVDKGFDTQNLIAVDVSLPIAKYADRKQRTEFYDRLLIKAKALPGVASASVETALPLEGESHSNIVTVEGDRRPLVERPIANFWFTSPEYFDTLGVALHRGRLFDDRDRGRKVIVLSERMARRLWPNQDPIGKRLKEGDETRSASEVIGVVADIRAVSLQREPGLLGYIPYWERGPGKAELLLRSRTDARAIAPAVRSAIWSVDPEVPVPPLRTMEQVLGAAVAGRRFQMLLAALFGVAALLLASLGIYGVVSYSVARRTSEMGIRMALGARAADVRWLVLRQGLRPVLLGLAAGVAVALALGQLLNSLLFGVSAHDPLTIIAVATLLSAVGAMACWVPALRATRADPMSALRYE